MSFEQDIEGIALEMKSKDKPKHRRLDEAVTIPTFTHTGEAFQFGKENAGDPEVIAELKRLRQEALAAAQKVRKDPDATDVDLQLGMDLATKAQFYREALEGAGIMEKKIDVKDRKTVPVKELLERRERAQKASEPKKEK